MKLDVAMVCALAGGACLSCGASPGDGTPDAVMHPPPVITAISPASGPWGTELTITGTGLGTPTAGEAGFDFGSAFQVPGVYPLQIETWTDTQIVGRVSYPGTGPVVVTAYGEAATGAAFTATPDWPAGPGFVVSSLQLAELRALSSGALVAVYRGSPSVLAVFSGAGAGAYPLPDLLAPDEAVSRLDARVVEADDGGALLVGGSAAGVTAYRVVDGALVGTPTGLGGRVLAAARDEAGVYAWLAGSDGLVRARQGSGSAAWLVDRGPFTDAPRTPLDAEVAPDGTLWVSFNQPNSDPFDLEGFVALQALPPAGSAFAKVELDDPANSYDDVISQAHITIAADSVHMLVYAYRLENGQESFVLPRLRTGSGAWQTVPYPMNQDVPDPAQYTFVGTTLAVAAGDSTAHTTAIIPDMLGAPDVQQVVPAWPAQVRGLVADGSGTLRPVLEVDSAFAWGPATPPPLPAP